MLTLRQIAVVAVLVYLFATGAGQPAWAAPGDLDSSFGSGGGVVTTFGAADPGFAVFGGLAVQPDGKFIVVGSARKVFPDGDPDGNEVAVIARYNANGTPDSTFGTAGVVLTRFPLNPSDHWLGRAVVLQPDGKIVVAGDGNIGSGLGARAILARYMANGTLDASFAAFEGPTEGFFPVNPGMVVLTTFCPGVRALRRQPDGKFVVLCSNTDRMTNFEIARMNADGSPDLAFGFNAMKQVGDFGGRNTEARALAIDSSGNIVVAGFFTGANFTLVHLSANGSQDWRIFAQIGIPGGLPTFFDGVRAVTFQPDGKIVAAGLVALGAGFPLALARYNPDGTPDSSFGSAGQVTTDVGVDPGAVGLEAGGKIVVAGVGSGGLFAIARYNADGTLDGSFGTGGKVLTDFTGLVAKPSVFRAAAALAIQPDGKIIAAWDAASPTSAFVAIARYIGGGGNTPAGTPVVTLGPVTLAFSNVTQAGTSTVTPLTPIPSPPPGFTFGTPATYVDIATTALFTGSVDVCISYAGATYTNEATLRLFHFEPGPVDVTLSLDTVGKVICGRVGSLSPFALAERVPKSATEQILDLIQLLKGRPLPPAVRAALTAALQQALANPRKVAIVCGMLDLFVRQVQLHAAHVSSAATASELIAEARAIKTSLACR